MQVYPNITVESYTIDRSKGGEYFVNAQVTINSKEKINKVSTKYETSTIFRLKSIVNCKNNSSNQFHHFFYYNVVKLFYVF